MRWFVNSRGFGYDDDYDGWYEPHGAAWVKQGNPSIITQLARRRLLDLEAPTLAIGRFESEWHLLIGGVLSESEERRDVSGARLWTQVVLVSGDERQLRAIAAAVLRDMGERDGRHVPSPMVQRVLDSAITLDPEGPGGYRIDVAALERGLIYRSSPTEVGLAAPDLDRRRSDGLGSTFRDLAAEIAGHRLPQVDGVLVLVVRAAALADLDEERVWRALTRTHDGPAGRWVPAGGALKEETALGLVPKLAAWAKDAVTQRPPQPSPARLADARPPAATNPPATEEVGPPLSEPNRPAPAPPAHQQPPREPSIFVVHYPSDDQPPTNESAPLAEPPSVAVPSAVIEPPPIADVPPSAVASPRSSDLPSVAEASTVIEAALPSSAGPSLDCSPLLQPPEPAASLTAPDPEPPLALPPSPIPPLALSGVEAPPSADRDEQEPAEAPTRRPAGRCAVCGAPGAFVNSVVLYAVLIGMLIGMLVASILGLGGFVIGG
jgi:hypothetical protein